MTTKQIAESIPHEFRIRILLEWLPAAKPEMNNQAFRNLWEAFFIYVDPNGVKKDDCPQCRINVLKNWKSMASALRDVEQEYNALEKI